MGQKTLDEISANLHSRLAAAFLKVTGERITDLGAAQTAVMKKLPYYEDPEADSKVPMLFGHP